VQVLLTSLLMTRSGNTFAWGHKEIFRTGVEAEEIAEIVQPTSPCHTAWSPGFRTSEPTTKVQMVPRMTRPPCKPALEW
jgi:hypothetical protein